MNGMKGRLRKGGSLVLAAAMVASALSGCGGDRKEGTNKSTYKNGVYTVRWDSPDPYGYTERLQIDVKDGAVTVLYFDGERADGSRKTQDAEIRQRMDRAPSLRGGRALYPQQFYPEILSSFQVAGGSAEEMEGVAGATRSTRSFQALLREVLAQNCTTGEAGELVLPLYRDGSYTVTQPGYDAQGYQEYLTLTVKNGQLTLEAYDAKNSEGALRSQAEAADFPVAPAAYAQRLREDFAAKGSADELETVAGATRSSLSFQELLLRAINNASFGGPEEDTLPVLKNGEYRAEMAAYENGWKDYLVLQIYNDRVTVKEFDGVNQAGAKKTEDEAFADTRKSTGYQTDLAAAFAAIASGFEAAGNQVEEMENVAGATLSTNNFKLLAGTLLGYNAKTGDRHLVTVDPLE